MCKIGKSVGVGGIGADRMKAMGEKGVVILPCSVET